jgi:hypothetical protein
MPKSELGVPRGVEIGEFLLKSRKRCFAQGIQQKVDMGQTCLYFA